MRFSKVEPVQTATNGGKLPKTEEVFPASVASIRTVPFALGDHRNQTDALASVKKSSGTASLDSKVASWFVPLAETGKPVSNDEELKLSFEGGVACRNVCEKNNKKVTNIEQVGFIHMALN